MKKSEILERIKYLRTAIPTIWGYMYGKPYYTVIHYLHGNVRELSELMEIEISSLQIWEEGLCHVWGFPGPDYTVYRYEDYGKTWAFSKDEIEKPEIPHDLPYYRVVRFKEPVKDWTPETTTSFVWAKAEWGRCEGKKEGTR